MNTLRDVIQEFRDGKFDPASHYDARKLLQHENCRRLESFLFEDVFLRSLAVAVGDGSLVSSNWYYMPDEKDGPPRYWFRVVTKTEPWRMQVDSHVARTLSQYNQVVVAAQYDAKRKDFTGRLYQNGGWEDKMPIDQLLTTYRLTRDHRPLVRPWEGARQHEEKDRTEDQRITALETVLTKLDDAERESLIHNRLFVYHVLHPWYCGWPADVDGVAIVNGRVEFFETKRVNPGCPAKSFLFEPHKMLYLELLQQMNRCLHTVFMVDPIWNKRASPLPILEAPKDQWVRWVHVPLDHDSALQFEHTTLGIQGMHGEDTRTDRLIIPWSMCRLIGSVRDIKFIINSMTDAHYGEKYPLAYDDLKYFNDACMGRVS